MAYETFSPEEVDGIVYRASPKVAPTTPAQYTPMQTAPLPSGPVKPPKAKAAEPNVSSLVQNVAEANKGIQESTPAPQAPSAIDALVKDVTDNWKTVLTVAAIPAIAMAANKMLGGKSSEESKGKPIKDRLLVSSERVEPTFSPPTSVEPAKQLPGTPEELQKALGPNWEATIAKSDAIRKEKQMLAQERARTSMGEVPPPTAAPAVPASQSPAPAPVAPNPVAQAAAQTAPVAPPTVAQLAQEAAPAVTTAAQAPAGSIPPATKEKNKGGRPKGAKTATAEEKAMKEAAKGINMYRNMFGFEAKDPTSAKSLAAIESTNRLIAEGFEGRIPGSRDPFLNPPTDVGASGKKFYAGTPEGHRNVYIPWLEKNLNTLPPETQSHVLDSMTKGQTKDIGKIVKGLGLAAGALGAYETAFAKTPGERGMAGANVLGAVLPPGADITEAGAPVLSPSILAAQKRQMEEMQKLGSPYRQR